MLCSAPQGAVLGALLFVILMTDIDKNIQNTNLGSFGEDTRIWHSLITSYSPQHLLAPLDHSYKKRNGLETTAVLLGTVQYFVLKTAQSAYRG